MKETDKATKRQVGGSHYKDMPIGPNEFSQINRNFIGPIEAKYLCRHGRKGGKSQGLIDLKKCKHFIDMIIEIEYSDEKANVTT